MTKATRDLLEQHFDTAFTAPDGIKKLRELILTLAMRGQLVEQNPADQPASELLKEIEAEKQRLVRTGKIKTPKPLPPIKSEEVPYQLPQGWEWVRVREICHDWGQKTPDSTFTYIDVGAIDNVSGKIGSNMQILGASDAPSRARKIVKTGTVIYSTVRPYLLNIAIIDKEYDPEPIASTAFAILHPFRSLSARFIYHYLRSPAFIRHVEATQKGVAYPAINDGDFFSGLFPLPPFHEQYRIVARIDQLMARCDSLEALRKEREEKRLAVHAAAIQQLLSMLSSSAWDFIEQHFYELYSVKENVAELRKAILQLAVMGQLVPQDPSDSPASELLKEIDAEKQRLVKAGKIKTPKPLPPIKPEEVPYQLPQGWEWVRLNEALDVRDGTHDTPKYVDSGYPLITSKNIYTGKLSLDDVKYISEEDHKKICERSRVDAGDILFAMIGSIGNPVIVECDTEFSIKNVALFKYHLSGKPDNRYLHYFLTLAQENMRAISSGAVQSFVSLGFLRAYLLPLPPLPEQHRIVARIDRLMALCDILDQQIDAATDKRTELLNAVMALV